MTHKGRILAAGRGEVPDRIHPTLPIYWTRPGSQPKPLPADEALFDYPNVCFAGDKVYIMYGRAWPEEGQWKRESVLRIYPLEWFYQ